ncbi:MAG: acyl carrier protein [Verrucomicrobiota bacterium]
MKVYTKEEIVNEVLDIIKDMTSDWEFDDFDGEIGDETKLVGDLSFESVEIVQLMVSLEQHFGIKNLASEKLLLKDGRQVTDLTVPEIAEFLNTQMEERS